MGFGASSPAAALGEALDFSVALRLDPGESLDPGCVSADVRQGDRRLPPDGVFARVSTPGPNGPVVRIRTTSRIEEPVVTIDVSVGCTARLSRQFVVFADPPQFVDRGMAVAAAAPVAPVVERAQTVRDEPAPIRSLPPPPPSRPATVDRPRPPVPPQPAVRQAPAKQAAQRASESVQPKPRAQPQPQAAAPPPKEPAPKPRQEARPRLRLDAAPPLDAPAVLAQAQAEIATGLTPETLALVDQANEAVLAAIAAAKASQERIAALERAVRQMQADAAAQRASVQQLRDRTTSAETRSRWMVPLLLAVAALVALCGWLWLRLRELESERQGAWLDAAQQNPPVESPSAAQGPAQKAAGLRAGSGAFGAGLAPAHPADESESPEPATEASDRTPAPPAPADPTESEAMRFSADDGPVPAMQQTQPLVPGTVPVMSYESDSRDVSAEELIDLEQQAEFFVVLGQDEAAIDLLVSHLRDTGGASPLPYLKLLEIYRRQGDRAAYERTRDRFNLRFNARAPAWDAPAHAGRSLEDYPHVMHWLQQVWPRPVDAMAELEAMLFRRDEGELFDLPAYRELLLLYAVAREEVEGRGASQGGAVDVLLPLGGGKTDFAGTSARPYFGLEPAAATADPKTSLDLDLNDPDPPGRPGGSRFGGLS